MGGFVIAGFVSTYFTVILLGFQMLFVIMGSSLQAGCHCTMSTSAGVGIITQLGIFPTWLPITAT